MAARKELSPSGFVKLHGKAENVMVQHRGDRHYVSSKHPDSHHYSAAFDNHEEAENTARELSGKAHRLSKKAERAPSAQSKVLHGFHEDNV